MSISEKSRIKSFLKKKWYLVRVQCFTTLLSTARYTMHLSRPYYDRIDKIFAYRITSIYLVHQLFIGWRIRKTSDCHMIINILVFVLDYKVIHQKILNTYIWNVLTLWGLSTFHKRQMTVWQKKFGGTACLSLIIWPPTYSCLLNSSLICISCLFFFLHVYEADVKRWGRDIQLSVL